MLNQKKIAYRKKVREKYLLPKLYELGYQLNDISFDSKLLLQKGRRKIYIYADLIIKVNNQAAIIVAVRHGGEEISEYSKKQLFAYAYLSEETPPLIMLTNAKKDLIYETKTKKQLAELPSKKELEDYLNKQTQINQHLKDEALEHIFQPISLWDQSQRLSPYHYFDLRSFDSPIKKPFEQLIYHGYNYLPKLPKADEAVKIMVSTKRNLVDQVFIYYTINNSKPSGAGGIAKNGKKLELERDYSEANPDYKDLIDWWSVDIPPQAKGRVRYIIEGYDSQKEKSYFADSGDVKEEISHFSYLTGNYQTPNWAKEAVVYQILVDRFCDGDPSNNYDLDFSITGYQGGDLQGVIDKLAYIKELGADTIWLSPIYEGLDYHGYHITDFTKVDKRFGDNQLLKELIAQAHQLDLKVILDFVPNHCSQKHPFFKQAQEDKASIYSDWYIFYDWPDDYETFCGLSNLPKINTENPATRNYLIEEIILDLVLEYEVDGLRMDYAYGPAHDFWVELRKKVKELAPETCLFGEVWEGPGITKKYAGELDGCFDFSLVWSFRELFIYGSKDVSEFVADLDYIQNSFPQEFIRGIFLDNHDMSRFLWEAANDKQRLKLAAICQFSLKGMQFIYYGTEVGLSQTSACFDDNTGAIVFDNSREFMLWGEKQDKSLHNFYQKLCQIRKANPVLSQGQRETILADSENNILVYKKYNQSESIIIILNVAETENRLVLAREQLGVSSESLTDLIANTRYEFIDDKLQLRLEPMQGVVLSAVDS